jgi:hypothetical protein
MGLTISASYIAERGFETAVGTELPERLLALGIAVGRLSEQVGLISHGVLGGMLGMVRKHHWCWDVAESGLADLSKGRGGAEKAKSKNRDLHNVLVWGNALLSGVVRAISIPNPSGEYSS